jgi:hypothetical protein
LSTFQEGYLSVLLIEIVSPLGALALIKFDALSDQS